MFCISFTRRYSEATQTQLRNEMNAFTLNHSDDR